MSVRNSSAGPQGSTTYRTNHSNLQANQPRPNPMSGSMIQTSHSGLQTNPANGSAQSNVRAPHNWNELLVKAKEATSFGVLDWMMGATITEGVINTAFMLSTQEGSLRSSHNFEFLLQIKLTAAGASPQVARGWANAVWKTWEAWASHYKIIPAPHFFMLAGISSTQRKGPAMSPIPLRAGVSSREVDILNIERAIRNNLYELIHEPGAEQAVKEYSQWFIKAFILWQNSTSFYGIYGEGDGIPIPVAPGVTMYQGIMHGWITCRAPIFGTTTNGFQSI